MTEKTTDFMPVSFRVTRKELEAMKKAASEEQRSVSGWLRFHIVNDLLQNRKRRRG